MKNLTLIFILCFQKVNLAKELNLLSNAQLTEKIIHILKKNGLPKENLHFELISLEKSEEIPHYYYQDEVPFLPASLTKIFTAVYALKSLSSEYRFKTEVLTTGLLSEDKTTWNGDIYIKGYGDPSLNSARLMDLVMSLYKLGIKNINGNFYFDESIQPTQEMITHFGNGDQTYNPGLSALNFEYNRFEVHRVGSRTTKKANFVVKPPLEHINIIKTPEEFLYGTRYKFQDSTQSETWKFSEKIKYSPVEVIPIRKPALMTAYAFRYLAQLWGMKIPLPLAKTAPKEAKILTIDHSPSLIKLLALTLEYSNNLFAEQILLTSAKKATTHEAAQQMSQWIQSQVPTCSHPLRNGSGLSSEHFITTRCLTEFIHKFSLQDVSTRGLISLLSISGVSGWLASRLNSSSESYKVWAKTGSLDYVNNISGVLFSKNEQKYAFTLSINDAEKRGLIDKATGVTPIENPSLKMKLKIEMAKRRAKSWSQKAKFASDQILRFFINNL